MIFATLDLETMGHYPQDADPAGGLLPWRVGFADRPSVITNFSIYDEGYDRHTAVATDQRLFTGSDYENAGLTNDIAYALESALNSVPSDRHILVWNGLFEAAWLYAYSKVYRPSLYRAMKRLPWLDGMFVYRLHKNTPYDKDSYGLKDAVRQHAPDFANYEDGVNLRKVDDALVEYNKLDTMLTTQVTRKLWNDLDERRRLSAIINSASCIPFGKTWYNGVTVNREYIETTLLASRDDFALSLDGLGIDAATLRSPVKLKAYLEGNDCAVPNTAKGTLAKAALENNLADRVRKARQLNTLITRTFEATQSALNFCDPASTKVGKIYPAPKLFATYTGRGTYQSKVRALLDTGSRRKTGREFPIACALHQVPRGPKARNMIVAPSGWLILECDYAGQEVRLMADYSQCPVMLSSFRAGQDLHSVMGARLLNLDYDNFIDRLHNKDPEAKNARQIGKVGNLSLGYRTSWPKLQGVSLTDFGIKLNDYEAQRLHSLYRQTYIGVPHYWEQAIRFASSHGYAISRGARRVHLTGWNDASIRWALEQTSINFPIQATAADMKMLAVALMAEWLDENEIDILFELHDALFFLIRDDGFAFDRIKYIINAMSTLPYEKVFGWTPSIPLPVDGKIGYSWGNLEELK